MVAIISVEDEVELVREKRRKARERLRRLGKTHVNGVYDDEYHRQKRAQELKLESLSVPEADAAAEAGKLIADLPRLWSRASLEERRKLLIAMLDAVHVDTRDSRSIVAINPKGPSIRCSRSRRRGRPQRWSWCTTRRPSPG